MKTLYVISMNHMDPVWKRCWDRSYVHEGLAFRPYSDIEESQVAAWLDLCEAGATYSVEQTITLRMYLERNPDEHDRIARLLREGKLEVLGCGETTVDTNLVHGETIIRSHALAIQWMQETFGCRPVIGAAPDTFGLSAQLPQIFRGLGYRTIQLWCRIFPDARPVWRGLDGSLIVLKDALVSPGGKAAYAVQTRTRPPSATSGGHPGPADGWTGLDDSVRSGSTAELFEKLNGVAQREAGEATLFLQCEELLPSPRLVRDLHDWGRKNGREIVFSTFVERASQTLRSLSDLEEGPVDQDFIDPRVEGNPVCTGCYLSRAALKSVIKDAETLLLTAERFAALVSEPDFLYPGKKLAGLWRKMSLLGFHDAITGSHVDAVNAELLDIAQAVQREAGAVLRRAMAAVVPAPEEITTEKLDFALFNPLEWPLVRWPVRVSLRWPKGVSDPAHLEWRDAGGKRVPAVDVTCAEGAGETLIEATLLPEKLPSCGYARFQVHTVAESMPSKSAEVFENEFYRISYGNEGLAAIHDRRSEVLVSACGCGDLVIEEDVGSAWETLVEPFYHYNLTRAQAWTRVPDLPAGRRPAPGALEVPEFRGIPGGKRLTLSGRYCAPLTGDGLRSWDAAWCQEISLFDGIDAIFFRTTIDWKTRDARIYAQFPLPFPARAGEADYEIPFGIVRRPAYEPRFGIHTCPNGDWPLTGFVSVPSGESDRRLSILMKGLAAARVVGNEIRLGLVRSSAQPVFLNQVPDFPDEGRHVFEYALVHSCGSLEDSGLARLSRQMNALFAACPADQHTAETRSLFDCPGPGILVSAIKRAEDGSGDIVVRAHEGYGKLREWFPNHAKPCNLLEEPLQNSAGFWRPWEIKTLRIEK